jgi:hypothetical protein
MLAEAARDRTAAILPIAHRYSRENIGFLQAARATTGVGHGSHGSVNGGANSTIRSEPLRLPVSPSGLQQIFNSPYGN